MSVGRACRRRDRGSRFEDSSRGPHRSQCREVERGEGRGDDRVERERGMESG